MNNKNNYQKNIEDIISKFLIEIVDIKKVKKIFSDPENELSTKKGKIKRWKDCSIVNGYLSVCIALAEINKVHDKDELKNIAHEYLNQAKKSFEKESTGELSIFSGIISLGFAAYSLSENKKYYCNFLKEINQIILKMLKERLEYIRSQDYIKYDFYDVIRGLSGVVRYLLYFKEDIAIKQEIIEVLKYLEEVIMTNINIKGIDVPKWYISNENQFDNGIDKEKYKDGSFNIGVAHGVAGVLGIFSICLEQNIEIKNHRNVISELLRIFDCIKGKDQNGFLWPGILSFDEFISLDKNYLRQRASWCYGDPGIARCIYLAGKAMNDKYYTELGTSILKSIAILDENEWKLESVTFCHGYSGLLQIMNLMYLDTKEDIFKKSSERIVAIILSKYNLNDEFGFKSSTMDMNTTEIMEKNDLGILDGFIGVILALFNFINEKKLIWDNPFMMN